MTTTQHDVTTIVPLPIDNPFGVGPRFEVVVRSDVRSFHGNLVVERGLYEAQQSDDAPEGVVTVWSTTHYAAGDRGGMFVSLSAHDWTFPGEVFRPTPEHDCTDVAHLRSGVAGGVFCGICRTEVFV